MSAEPVPFFALETHLVDRLKEKAADGVKVLTAADLGSTADNRQHTPAYQVIYGGYRVVESSNSGARVLIEQRWFVLTATRNARDQISGTAGRQAAGDLINTALRALLGWAPSTAFKRLELGTGGAPNFLPGGYAYYPLLFLSQLSVSGESVRAVR